MNKCLHIRNVQLLSGLRPSLLTPPSISALAGALPPTLHTSCACAHKRAHTFGLWCFLLRMYKFFTVFPFSMGLIIFSTSCLDILSYFLRAKRFQGQERKSAFETLTSLSPSNSLFSFTNDSGGL